MGRNSQRLPGVLRVAALKGEAVSEGDFADFATAELPRLLRLARVLAGNEHDAWDLTQEALVRVGLRWPRIDHHGNPGAYARTTLIRLNIDRLRRIRREFPLLAGHDRPAPTAEGPGLEGWLIAAWTALSPHQRTAVSLRYFLDLDVEDIARQMGCSTGTVRAHLSRGLQRLRDRNPCSHQLGGKATDA